MRAPDASFLVFIAGTPKHKQTEATSLALGKVTVKMLTLVQGQWAYSASWVDYPKGSHAAMDIDLSLDQGRDGAVDGDQGTLLGEEHITDAG